MRELQVWEGGRTEACLCRDGCLGHYWGALRDSAGCARREDRPLLGLLRAGPWTCMLLERRLKTCERSVVPLPPQLNPTTVVCKLRGGKNATLPHCPAGRFAQEKTQWERSRQRVCWFFPERRACQHLGVQQPPRLTSANPLAAAPASGAGARLPMPFLFGSAHSYFKSGLGLSQGHYRVSSLAFAPIAEKQVQCRALGFLNSCRGRNLSQQSCRGRAGTQRGLCAGRRGVEGRVATLYARGSRPLGGLGR